MSKRFDFEQLDDAIDRLIAHPSATSPAMDANMFELLETAETLRQLPRPEFKARLKADLEEQASAQRIDGHKVRHGASEGDLLPSLFASNYSAYPMQRWNFVASFVLHTAAAALIISSGMWLAQHREAVAHEVVHMLGPEVFTSPGTPDKTGGGGGGGDADKLKASKGMPPRFAGEQLTPPTVVVRTPQPRLSAEATVVGPPQLQFPQGQMGDPLSAILGPPSNGPGIGGGIGSGHGGGVGSGIGPGVGPGFGGGYGGGVYRVGGGVSAPRTLYAPDPDYSEEARKVKYQGTVILWTVIGPDGRAHEIKVARALGMGLDQKAVEAVRKWRFAPALKDGQPVAVQINVEVNFRLY